MKKYLKIFLIIAFIFITSYTILTKPIGDMDEIWNYNTARAISEGMLPYRDVSMITGPLLHSINAVILKLFCNELFTMRILAIILITSILFLIYCILEKLDINKSFSIISVFAITYLTKEFFCIDYNFFILFLTLIILLIELIKKDKNENILNFIIGLIGGLCVLTKQTTGSLICLAIIGYNLLFIILKKNTLKKMLFILLGMIIPLLIFVGYLIVSNTLGDYLDYCIYGIKTFDNKIEYTNLIKSENLLIKLLSILVPITLIVTPILAIKYKKENLIKLSFLSIAEFVVAFPISDNIHFLIGSMLCFIEIVFGINILINKNELSKNKQLFFKFFFEYTSYFIIGGTIIYSIYLFYKEFNREKYFSNLEHFKNIEISQEFEEEIKDIDEYIENSENDIYMLNFDAALYMIPINKYNKNYDMFLKGNIGSKGEEGQIETIKNTDAKFLIIKDGLSRNWQNPEKVRNYIKNNMNKTGEINNFDIYEN